MIKKIKYLIGEIRFRTKMVDKWKDVMVVTENYNKDCNTYTLYSLTKYKNEYKAELFAPEGLELKGIDNLKNKIEEGLHCKFERSEIKFSDKYNSDYCDVRFIFNEKIGD